MSVGTSMTLAYAETAIARGWTVLISHDVSAGVCSCPLGAACGKNAGKHPVGDNWRASGLRDIEAVGRALAYRPNANLSVKAGVDSGLWVFDVDPKSQGDVRLGELLTEHGPLPVTYTVRTGSGGWHYYFALPGDFGVTNAKGRLPTGLDVRGEGGQVIAPPSVSGIGAYSVLVDAPVADAPEWLLDMIRPRVPVERERPAAQEWTPPVGGAFDPALLAYARRGVDDELLDLACAAVGSRGDTAYRVACSVAELCNAGWAGLNVDQVEAMFMDAARRAMDAGPGFNEAEAARSWRRGVEHVGGRARELPPGIDAGGGVPNPFGAESAPFDGAASTGGPVPPGLANPFQAVPAQRASSEQDVSVLTPEVARRVWQMEIEAQAKAEMKRRAEAGAGAAERRKALSEQMVSADKLAAMKGPEPLVDGLLNLDTTAWLIGKSGSYKSFVCLDLAAHVAAGRDWQGRKVVAGNVVYIVAEGATGMTLRMRSWTARHGSPGDALSFLPRPVSVADSTAWADLVAVCAEMNPVLVIVDTQARASVGLEENSNTEMMRYVAAVDDLRAATGACVLTVHHIGRTGTDARGASAIDGAQDTELRIERTGTRAVRIHQDKQKDADDEASLDLSLELEGESLVVAGAALVNPFMTPERAREERRDSKRQGMQDVAIDLLPEVYAAGMGGTKAEIRRAVFERMGRPDPGDERNGNWDKVWNRLVSTGVVGKIKGTASWLYIPVDDRRKLIEPVLGGRGFYAPSDDQTT